MISFFVCFLPMNYILFLFFKKIKLKIAIIFFLKKGPFCQQHSLNEIINRTNLHYYLGNNPIYH